MDYVLKVLFNASIAYIFLFIISKLLGKKQIAELNFIDYVTGISIGSIASEMATNLDRPFYLYLISMSIFFFFDIFVTLLSRKTNTLKSFLRGNPIILINSGKINFKNLKRSKIDFYSLLGLAREKGFFSLDEIEFAIFETNGQLSILPKDEKRQLVREDFNNISSKKQDLTYYLVVDGQISKYALNETGKTKKWVLSKIKEKNLTLNQILLATLNEDNETLTFNLKNEQ